MTPMSDPTDDTWIVGTDGYGYFASEEPEYEPHEAELQRDFHKLKNLYRELDALRQSIDTRLALCLDGRETERRTGANSRVLQQRVDGLLASGCHVTLGQIVNVGDHG